MRKIQRRTILNRKYFQCAFKKHNSKYFKWKLWIKKRLSFQYSFWWFVSSSGAVPVVLCIFFFRAQLINTKYAYLCCVVVVVVVSVCLCFIDANWSMTMKHTHKDNYFIVEFFYEAQTFQWIKTRAGETDEKIELAWVVACRKLTNGMRNILPDLLLFFLSHH